MKLDCVEKNLKCVYFVGISREKHFNWRRVYARGNATSMVATPVTGNVVDKNVLTDYVLCSSHQE